MLRQQSKILEVYIVPEESLTPQRPGNYLHECNIHKLTWFNISQAEWAAGALRRVRNVREVIDVGVSTDSKNRIVHTVKVLYNLDEIRNFDAFVKEIRLAAEQTSLQYGAHL